MDEKTQGLSTVAFVFSVLAPIAVLASIGAVISLLGIVITL